MNANAVAAEIHRQLGGRRFDLMTGAKDFIFDSDATTTSLTFKLPRGTARNRANLVKVTLNPTDTYTVAFFRFKGFDVKQVSEHSDIYADMLRPLFAEQTGLALSL
jgi:hypothetical protein